MLLATIRDGRIEASGPIPNLWEGMTVQIVPLPPNVPDLDEDFTPDELERRLQVLRDLGPMEYEDGEREVINRDLMDMDCLSREQVARQIRDASWRGGGSRHRPEATDKTAGGTQAAGTYPESGGRAV